jgi:hypothetical protein
MMVCMRKSIFKFLQIVICLSFFGCVAVFADDSSFVKNKEVSLKKTYVEPKDIHFHEKNLYVLINGNWAQANAIYVDEYGPYVDSWTCSGCGGNTTSNPWTCDVCGRRRN